MCSHQPIQTTGYQQAHPHWPPPSLGAWHLPYQGRRSWAEAVGCHVKVSGGAHLAKEEGFEHASTTQSQHTQLAQRNQSPPEGLHSLLHHQSNSNSNLASSGTPGQELFPTRHSKHTPEQEPDSAQGHFLETSSLTPCPSHCSIYPQCTLGLCHTADSRPYQSPFKDSIAS